jgi:hypothetical protein
MPYLVSVSAKIDVGSYPTKTVYTVGEELDLSGGVLLRSYREFYSDGSYTDVVLAPVEMKNASYRMNHINISKSDFDSSKAGVCTISVIYYYKDSIASTDFEVEVRQPVTTATTTTTTATELTTTTTTTTTTMTTTSTTTTTMPYVVSVSAKLDIGSLPYKTTYTIGDELDLSGGTVLRSYREFYSDGSYKDTVLEPLAMDAASYRRNRVNIVKSDFDSSKAGTQTISVSYYYLDSIAYAEFKVEVNPPVITTTTTAEEIITTTTTARDERFSARVEIMEFPYKIVYTVGEQLQLAGLRVDVYHTRGDNEELINKNEEVIAFPEKYEVTGYDSSMTGLQRLELQYKVYNEAVAEWVTASADFEVRVEQTTTTTTETTTTTTTTTVPVAYSLEMKIVDQPQKISYNQYDEEVWLGGMNIDLWRTGDDGSRVKLLDRCPIYSLPWNYGYSVMDIDRNTTGYQRITVIVDVNENDSNYDSYAKDSDSDTFYIWYEPVTTAATTTMTTTTTTTTTSTTTTTTTSSTTSTTTTTKPRTTTTTTVTKPKTTTTTKLTTTTVTTTVPVTTTTVPQPPKAKLGDVDGDGKVNAVDASYILSEYASTSTGHKPSFDPEKRRSADVNGDGAVNAVDASIVLSYYAYRGSGGTIEDLREWLK